MTNKKIVDLSYEGLTTLPNWIKDRTELEYLNLSGNHLKELPSWLGNLSALKELDLSGNQIDQTDATTKRVIAQLIANGTFVSL